ncbi:MAG: hypothetical protein LBF61_10300 [Azoarcus sp.]|nr:hypothetical protein [Azoarcus sp.]
MPDQPPASIPSSSAPPSAHYRKNINPVWLAIGGVFVLIVGGLWWGLGMGDPPVINPKVVNTKVVNTTPPTEPTHERTPDVPPLVGQTPDDPPLVTPPPDSPPLVGQTPDDPPLVMPPTDDPPLVRPPTNDPPLVRQPTNDPPPRPPRTRRPKPLPIPPEWLGVMREELARCENFFCHSTVQRTYCDGYWNRIPECKRRGNGL